VCSALILGLLLPASGARGQAAPSCPPSASYCSVRTLFLPPIDGSGTLLIGSSDSADGDVLAMSGSSTFLSGNIQQAFDVGFAFQHRSGFTFGVGAPLALLPREGGGLRTSAALTGDLRVPIVQPTAGQFGGFAAHALLRAQTPGLVSGEAAGDSSAFELRALLSWRAFIVHFQPTVGILVQPDRPGETWRIPFGGAVNLHFAPPSWNDDARPRLFVEWLLYGGERWSHAAAAGLAFHFKDGSFSFGVGGAQIEGTDSLFLRFSWTARALVGDSDGDGVPDDVDQCRFVPEDRDNDRDEDGCPEDREAGRGMSDTDSICTTAAPALGPAQGALALESKDLAVPSTKRLLAALAPEICEPSFRGYLSSDSPSLAEAAKQAIIDFTGRAEAVSVVAPAAWDAVVSRVGGRSVGTASPSGGRARVVDYKPPASGRGSSLHVLIVGGAKGEP